MIHNKLLSISLNVLPGIIVFVELFLVLPIMKCARRMLKVSGKAVSVMKSKKISDHWKEKAILRYSRNIMIWSLEITVYIVILFLAFAGVYYISGLLFIGNLDEIIKTFHLTETQILTIVLGVVYAFLRNKFKRLNAKDRADYTVSSKMLHHLALGNSIIKEMAFDIDCMMMKLQPAPPRVSSPVYIAGLARAGTTILLEALYSTGAFTTLTYRDMPLVTAPYLWSKITKGSKIDDQTNKERAHGDSLYVNYDSPEAFEEVFWMTFSNAAYIKDAYLEVQDVDRDLIEKYKKFVTNIIAKSGKSTSIRYLAKNNNNLLRIDAIKSAFADAIVIVPFRNPIDHAKSLHNQHERFLKKHAEDSFTLKYMNWLGHFEFGANFKPFKVNQEALFENEEEPGELNYWLLYWRSVYKYLIEQHASNAVFFNYDKFCEQPEKYLAKLETELLLSDDVLKRFPSRVRPAKNYFSESEIPSLPSQVKVVYDELRAISL